MKLKFTYKIIIIGIVLITIFLVSPKFDITGLDTVFNSVTFIFGVLYGFEISIVLGNFSSLKVGLATLTAQLRSTYSALKIVNPKAADVVGDKIEAYVIKSIELDLIDHAKTEEEFTALLNVPSNKEVIQATLDDADAQGIRMQFVYQGLYDMTNSRNQIEQVAPKFIELPEWMMLIVLACIMIGILFLQRTADPITNITSAILATTILGSLIILNDIDSNDLQEGFLEYGLFNDTLTQIGKEPYYPDYAIKSGVVKLAKGTKYRKGIFDESGRKLGVKNEVA